MARDAHDHDMGLLAVPYSSFSRMMRLGQLALRIASVGLISTRQKHVSNSYLLII